MSGSVLHPKFKESIFTKDVQFNEDAYENNRKFAIYTQKDTDWMQKLLDKHDATMKAQKEKERLARSQPGSPKLQFGSQYLSSSHKNFYEMLESPKPSPKVETLQTEGKEEGSKLKSKMQKELELAKSFDFTPEQSKTRFTEEIESPSREVIQTQPAEEIKSSVTQRMLATTGIFETSKMVSSARSPKSWATKTGKTNIFGIKTKDSALKRSLYYDSRTKAVPKSSLKNPVVEDLVDNEELITSKPELLESILKLRDMQLLKTNQPSTNKFKGVGKIDYVYNDFHSRSTNPGYSRNTAGCFYFR